MVLNQELEEAKKLIMLTPEQQRIIYSKKKHKVIKGSFGSGKTIIAQQIIKLVANSMSNELIYYLFHDTTSVYIQEMIKLAKQLNNNNIIACKMTDLVKDQITLSAVLSYLLNVNAGKTVHAFVEEFNGEVLDDKEVDIVKVLLEKDEFRNSHIVLVAQSMESKRFEIHEEYRLPYEKYNYKKLIEDTSFELFTLTYLIRSSVNINKIIDIAIPMLTEDVLKSIVPKFEAESKSKLTNLKMTQEEVRKKNLHIQSSKISDIDIETQKNQIKVIQSSSFDRKLMDTDKMLNYWTRNEKSYRSKTNIESKFAFVGDRENLHNVQGSIPNIYYPFNKDIKSYIHQVYGVSGVLKSITSTDDEHAKQVIICLNSDSMAILKDALQCSKLQWTDDISLYSKGNIDILLTDYTYVRGCEFANVILIYPINENHLKHNLVDSLNRCSSILSIMVLLVGIYDPTLYKILLQWINEKLVQVNNYDYLENADKLILKKFEENNKHLQKNDNYNQDQLLDMSDPAVRLNIDIFKSIVPKFEAETKSKLTNLKMTQEEEVRKKHLHIQSSKISDIEIETQKKKIKVIQSSSFDRMLMDTDEMLKHWTRNVKSYRSKTNIESENKRNQSATNNDEMASTSSAVSQDTNNDEISKIEESASISQATNNDEMASTSSAVSQDTNNDEVSKIEETASITQESIMVAIKKTDGIKVKNVSGTGDCPPRYGSFIKYWEKKTGLDIPEECRIRNCIRKAEYGAHIKFFRDPDTIYILPMCTMHNNPYNDDWMVTNKDGLAVEAPDC